MARIRQQVLGDCDLVIIGGGPAGCSMALNLQRLNPRLARRSVLLEKSFHPREKICGGALTLNAERLLSELDINVSVPYAPVHNVRLTYGQVAIDLAEDGCAKKVVRRRDFDGMLWQTAKERGFTVVEGVHVTKVVRQPDHLQIHTTHGYYRAKVAVGADGVGAILRKTPGFHKKKAPARLWLAETPVDPEATQVFREQVLLIDLSYIRRGVRGYYWEFPCFVDGQAFASRGLVDSNPDRLSRIRGKELLSEILVERGVPMEGARKKAFPMRHFNPKDVFAQPRMLLIGDALGSDSLFSEGISQAISFGRIAAEAVIDGFQRNDLSFASYRKRVLASRVGQELRACTRLAKCFYGTHMEFFLSLLREDEQLRDLLAHSYAGTADLHQSTRLILNALLKHVPSAKARIRRLRECAGFAASSSDHRRSRSLSEKTMAEMVSQE